jgi:hypothetical protein
MRRDQAAALVIACVVAFGRPANAAPNVYRLSASDCQSAPTVRRGTAFVVKAFQPGQTPVVLVTALHVIHTCRYIGVYDLACQADDEPRDVRMSVDVHNTIQIWREWDLAVLPVPDPAKLQLEHPVNEELDFADNDLHQLLALDKAQTEILIYHLPGTSEAEGCRRGTVNHTSVRKSGLEYSELALREVRRTGRPVTAKQLLGPLSPDRWLLNYHGDMSGGASGSPVTRGDGYKVIAVHEAGFTDRESGWGVVIAGSGLDKVEPEKFVMGDTWPEMHWSYLVQSAPDSIAEAVAEVKKNAKRVPSQHFVSLSLGLGSHTRDPTGSSDYDLMLGYALHPSVEHTRLGYLKLGFAVDLNGGLDSSHRDYFSPSGDRLESVPKDLGWFHVAGGVDLRLERLHSWFSPSLSGGALLGRWVYGREPSSDSEPTNWDIGLWVSAKNRLVLHCAVSRQVGCLHLVGAIDATFRNTPTFDYQYTGIGGDVTRLEHDRWHGYVGVSLGVELGVDP